MVDETVVLRRTTARFGPVASPWGLDRPGAGLRRSGETVDPDGAERRSGADPPRQAFGRRVITDRMRAGLSVLLFIAAAASVAALPGAEPAVALRFTCGDNPVTRGRPLDLTIAEPTRATAAPLHGGTVDFAARPGRPLDLFSQRGYRIRLDPDRAGLRLNAPGEATLRCRRVSARAECGEAGPAGTGQGRAAPSVTGPERSGAFQDRRCSV